MLWLKSNRLDFVAGSQKILAHGNQYSGGALLAFEYLFILPGGVCGVRASSRLEHPSGPVAKQSRVSVSGFFQELSELLLFRLERFVLPCHT